MMSQQETKSEQTLVIDESRYSRMELIAWWDQEKLQNAKVLVVGVGALGNEVVKNLTLMGVGHLYLIDFDTIEVTNLNKSILFRQSDCGRRKVDVAADFCHELNPDTKVTAIHGDITTELGLGLFRDVDVVIGCLDNREARLWVNRMCWRVSTPWVDGAIQEINGVVKVFTPPDGACYECAMTDNDYRLISLRYSCPLLKREDILAGKVPTSPTISAIVAGVQSQEALKIIHGMDVDSGTAFVFNGIANSTYKTRLPFKEECLSHESFDEPVITELRSESSSVADLFEVARGKLGDGQLKLILDRDLVTGLKCHACEVELALRKCRDKLTAEEAVCSQCSEMMKPELVLELESDGSFLRDKLCEVGIPPQDIVQVRSGTERAYYLLADKVEG